MFSMTEQVHTGAVTRRSGFVLPVVMGLIAVVSFVGAAFMVMNRNAVRTTEKWRQSDQALLAAQSVLEGIRWGIYDEFRDYYINVFRRQEAFDWFNGWSAAQIGTGTAFIYSISNSLAYSKYPGVTVQASILAVTNGTDSAGTFRQVTLKATATGNGISRSIQEDVKYGLQSSKVFNYVYFLNNFGWFYGVNIIANGDLRSNYDMAFRSTPLRVNGDSFAAGTTSGDFQSWSFAEYYGSATCESYRPSTPTALTNSLTWPMGYDGDGAIFTNAQLEMPYLGDLSIYTNYAAFTQGKVVQGTNILVDQVYDGPGPNTNATVTADDGCLILNGTAANPLVISGAVVIAKDIIISGYVTGQGTLYAGRNIHIVDDIIAVDPPSWPKPDNDPYTTVTLNRSKDLIGLAAKGNVIYGDYTISTWQNNITTYAKPPFTSAYPVDATDTNIGYCTSMANGTNYFHGDYTTYEPDGYQVANNWSPTKSEADNRVRRRYYESSLSDNDFRAASGSGGSYNAQKLNRLDCVIYNNHLTAGFIKDCVINGGLVARDEAIYAEGQCDFNWDIRLGDRSEDRMDTYYFLPTELSPPLTVTWREVP